MKYLAAIIPVDPFGIPMNLYRLGLSWTTMKPALIILGTLGPILEYTIGTP